MIKFANGPRQMVCEGACNPRRREIEAMIPPMKDRYVSGDRDRRMVIAPISDEVARALRTLTHTEHREAIGGWTCSVCGSKRD